MASNEGDGKDEIAGVGDMMMMMMMMMTLVTMTNKNSNMKF